MKGKHVVCRSNQRIGRVWADMALKQSIAIDSKNRGGILGITHRQDVMDRCFLTNHERAAITSATNEICAVQESGLNGSYKETGPARRIEMSVFKAGLAIHFFDIDALEDYQ